MRDLNFKVSGQRLEALGDYSDLVPGTEGYLFASFEFSDEWNGCAKIASFFDRVGVEHAVCIVNNRCAIPSAVLTDRIFKIQVIGKSASLTIPTNTLIIKQKG